MERLRKQRFGRVLGVVVVGLVGLAVAATASASHPTLSHSSTFDASNEGWEGVGPGTDVPMTWLSSGGNPNGYITTNFSDGIGFAESVPTGAGSTWLAGNALGDYGGTLGADVRVELDGTSLSEELGLAFFSTNASESVCSDSVTPTSSWATYAVTLDTSHLYNCDTKKPLTGAQASAALAGFGQMVVLALNNDQVAETLDVDNAELSPPQEAVTPPTGKVARSFLNLAYKAHTLSGWFTAPDDYSCVEKAKLTLFETGKKPLKVGTVSTSSEMLPHYPATTFSFKLKKSAKKGRYYVSAANATSKLDGNRCAAVKSKSVKVR